MNKPSIESPEFRMKHDDNPAQIVRQAILDLQKTAGTVLSFELIMEYIRSSESNPNRKWDFSSGDERDAFGELLGNKEIVNGGDKSSNIEVVKLKTGSSSDG